MISLERLLTGLYVYLLRLFPRPFRGEFESEMQGVFTQVLRRVRTTPGSPRRRRVEMIRLFLSEVVDLPAAVWSALRFKPMQIMGSSEMPDELEHADSKAPGREGNPRWTGEPSTWIEALLGVIPFILFGLAYFTVAVYEMSAYHTPMLTFFNRYALQVVYFLSLIGMIAGWVKGFPRWSYAYIGMVLYFAANIFNMRYSLIAFGERVWIPAILAVLIALLITRSLHPLGQLLQGIWYDWSRLSFVAYAYLVPIFTIMFIDGEWGTSALVGLLFDTLLLAGGAIVFLRSRVIWQRALSLQAAVFFLAFKGMLFSSWFPGMTILLLLFWSVLMFAPGLVVLLSRRIGALQAR